MIIWVVLRGTVYGVIDGRFDNLSGSHHQSQSHLMMTSAQVVKTSVNITTNSPSQDYTHLDDHTLPTSEMTPGFKPLILQVNYYYYVTH